MLSLSPQMAESVGIVTTSINSSDDNGNDTAKPEAIFQDDDGAEAALDEISQSIIDDVMLRLTKGLPRFELDLIVKEADECERALQEEIIMLEKESAALKAVAAAATTATVSSTSNPLSMEGLSELGETKVNDAPPFQYGLGMPYATVDDVLRSEYTTVDRFITLSALLGRLFIPLPLPASHPYAITLEEANKKIPKQQRYQQKRRVVERQQQLLALQQSPYYTKRCTAERWTAMLTSVWKKISSHKTALVFRRPVNDRDAPGYSDRILFPMDLSLVRKMVTSQQIQSLEDLHTKIALICHNCVKFNGGASDYGLVAKDFEAYVDDAIITAVENAATTAQEMAATTASPSASVANIRDHYDTSTEQKDTADGVVVETKEGTSEKYTGCTLIVKGTPKEGSSDAATIDGEDQELMDRKSPVSASNTKDSEKSSELRLVSSESITMDFNDTVVNYTTSQPIDLTRSDAVIPTNENMTSRNSKASNQEEADKYLSISVPVTLSRKRASAVSPQEIKVKKKKKGAKNSS